MYSKIKPPNSWVKSISNINEEDIHKLLFENYKEGDIIFKIIKNDGSIKNLTKTNCILASENLAFEIDHLAGSKAAFRQLKIMAVIGASEESAILMLSSLFLNAHHCICFEDLSEEAISKRCEVFNPDILICRKHLLEKIQKASSKLVRKDIPILPINLNFNNSKLSKQPYRKLCNNYIYKTNSSLFTLFTSGTTGFPKAIVHGTQKYLNYAKYTTNHFFGIKKGSKIFTAVDAGWINGHTYSFYGPLLLGAISIINENPNLISIPRLLGNYLYTLKPDCFYTSVTLLRLLKSLIPSDKKLNDYAEGEILINRIGSCGEPLAHEVGKWAIEFFRPTRKCIVNTYFQTETGGVLVAPRDEDNVPNNYSSVGKPNSELGMTIAKDIYSQSEIEEEGLDPNEILICKPWDGIFKEIISDKKSDYFTKAGFYRLHDVGYFDEEKNLFVGGRSDDVINVSGHRISSSEIESVSIAVENVDEACAVAIPDQISGSKVALYISSVNFNSKLHSEIELEIKNKILSQLSKYHLPKNIIYFKHLPKTKSGKIMRRLMRELNEESFHSTANSDRDYSTLANKENFLISKKEYLESINKTI